MIDENKLFKELEDWKHMDKNLSEIVLMTIDTFEKIIKNQPKTNQWISVEKQLPKEKGIYLCCFNFDGETYIGENTYNGAGIWLNEKSSVIAWQPLPTPYKIPTFSKMETVECSYKNFIQSRFNRRY